MTICKGLTPGRTYGKRRIMAQAQRCGAIAEPGIEWCAAHAKQRGLLKCPQHGWVTTRTAHSFGTGIASAAVVMCSADRCDHVFELQREPWGPRLGVMGP